MMRASGSVERRDVGQVDTAALVEGDEQPFLGGADGGDGRARPDHVPLHDGGLRGRAGVWSHSSRAMTSMASGSSRNLTRFGIRRMTVPSSLVLEKVVLLIGPYCGDEDVVGRFSSRRASSRCASGQPSFWDCRTRRASSRSGSRAPSRLPVMVPSACRASPPYVTGTACPA